MSQELQPIPRMSLKTADGKNIPVMAQVGCGTVEFSVDVDNDAQYPAFPRQFFSIQSITTLTYLDVHKAFTDEDTFHALQACEAIFGSGQRRYGNVDDPNPESDKVFKGISISLAGMIPADQMMALYIFAQDAGHMMLPKMQVSSEGNTYTIFTLIPNYEALCGA